MHGWVAPLGIRPAIGSLFASLWILEAVAIVVLFSQQGRAPDGAWRRAAIPYALLAAWCELLILGGIVVTAQRHDKTYYEGPFEAVKEHFHSVGEHVRGHVTGGFFVRLAIALLLGAGIYALARRRRPAS